MSYDQDNVLERALRNNELDKFLVGEPFYFMETKDDNDEPQNVIVSIALLFLPYIRATGDSNFPLKFTLALIKMLENYPDRNRAIYMAQRWVWGYRYCLSQKHVKPQGPYADLFECNMNAVATVLKQQLEANKADLMTDTRWAGQSWNSNNGLWEPMMDAALIVRDELGGPDFVPSNM